MNRPIRALALIGIAVFCSTAILGQGCNEQKTEDDGRRIAKRSPWGGGLAPSIPHRSDPSGVTVLLTDPTYEVMRDWVELVESGMLRVARLRIVGVYHADQDFASIETRDFLAARKVDWISLRRMDCPVGEDPFVYSPKCYPDYMKLFDEADGLVLPPGPDLPPRDYGEATSLLTRVGQVERTRFELSLLAALFGTGGYKDVGTPYIQKRPEFVVLGIGLGHQELNVALGGTLVQDIPTEIYGVTTAEKMLEMAPVLRHENYDHFRFPGDKTTPWIRHPIVPDDAWRLRAPRLSKITEIYVLSRHHQAVEKLGVDLFPLAASVDGLIVEAIGHRSYPGVLGVQFEPESSEVAMQKGGLSEIEATSALGKRRFEDMVAFHRLFWDRFVKLLSESNAARTGVEPDSSQR